VGFSRLYLRGWIWARWNCEGCGTRLRFDLKTRLVIGLLLMAWGALCFSVAICIALFLHLYGWILTGAFVAAYIIGFFLVFRLDRIAVAKPIGPPPTEASVA